MANNRKAAKSINMKASENENKQRNNESVSAAMAK